MRIVHSIHIENLPGASLIEPTDENWTEEVLSPGSEANWTIAMIRKTYGIAEGQS